MGDFTPDNVLGCVARDAIPWDNAWRADFAHFAAHFTLHDSRWIGMFLALAETNEAVLILQWDVYWQPAIVSRQVEENECPTLLIQIPDLRQIYLEGYQLDQISGRTVSWSDCRFDGECFVLEIGDHYGGQLRLVYQGQLAFLALREDMSCLGLSDVEPDDESE